MRDNRNIGIFLPHLSCSQLEYSLIKYINTNTDKGNYVIFYEDLAQGSVRPACAMMNCNELWAFHGRLITTSLRTTSYAIKAITSSDITFYVWDLEWLRGEKDFISNLQIFGNPMVKLACRSESHKREIENYANREVRIVEPNFNIAKLLT